MSIKSPVFFLFVLAGLYACQAQPEPIRYGVDLCHFCKMTQMDEKFGCELITKKGKILKFDDPICLIRFLRSGEVSKNGIRQLLVVNFEKKGELLPVEKASFLIADYVVSPMGSRLLPLAQKMRRSSL